MYLLNVLTRVRFGAIIAHTNSRSILNCTCKKSLWNSRVIATFCSKATDSAADFKLRSVEFYTNCGRWDEKPNGALVKATFIDTCYDASTSVKAKMPVLLGLHGSPGNHNELITVVEPFIKEGYRIILLNFPGYGQTVVNKDDEDFFMHSTEEKSQFVIDFLEAIEVTKKIDIGIGHSMGCLALVFLSAMTSHFRSLALISPAPVQKPPRSAEPFFLVQLASTLWETKILRPILRLLTVIVSRTKGLSVKPRHVPALIHSAANAHFGPLQGYAYEVERKKVPLVFFFCKPDSFISSKMNFDHAAMYGITDKNTDVYTADGQLTQKGEPLQSHYAKGVLFTKATHFPHRENQLTPIIVGEIKTLLKHVHDSNAR